jgi:hypothetical protein
MNETEKSGFLSKDILDTENSFSWFLMDASWMLQKTCQILFPTSSGSGLNLLNANLKDRSALVILLFFI